MEINLKKEASVLVNLLNSNRFEEAINKAVVLNKKFPDQPFFYNALSLSYNGINEFEKSLNVLNKGLKRDAKEVSLINNLGLTYLKMGNEEQAEKKFNNALKINPKFLNAYINLAHIKKNQNKSEEAITILMHCLGPNPNNFVLNFALANNYQSIGKFIEAKKLYKKCLELNPKNTVVDQSLSMIINYSEDSDHLKSMQLKLSETNDRVSQMYLNFAVGKAFEDLKEYKKAFVSFKKANDIKNELSTYNIDQEAKSFNKIKSIFSNSDINKEKKGGAKIIFVVGMPRSGTSLVEQILSTHNEIYGAGELSFLSDLIEKKINFEKQDYSELQTQYSNLIKKFKYKEEYLIDKTPLNFKWIGFILNHFPNSKIIHCKRNPIDVCWSNYKNLFSSKKLDYSYNFSNLSIYYKLYEDLMMHWSKIYKNKFYEIDYEKLVENKEKEIKKIIKYLELEWDANCLNFHKNKRSVSTASLAQVRKPIYNSSVEKWKSYGDELSDLIKKLS
jgi:tetratricopeptide (TPR) repeat protein